MLRKYDFDSPRTDNNKGGNRTAQLRPKIMLLNPSNLLYNYGQEPTILPPPETFKIMAKITVYTTQDRLQYSAQIPCIRPKRKPPTPQLTLSQALCLMRHPDSGEYLQAPVVIAGDRHWSGYRSDHIADLARDIA